MRSAIHLRHEIESALAHKIPSALTPRAREVRPTTPTGIEAVDRLLEGGLPIGALTELVGPDSSGRTSLALSTVACLTSAGKVCAWVDVSDSLKPECVAAAGVSLPYVLWVRCGMAKEQSRAHLSGFQLPKNCLVPPATTKGLHGGGCGTHPCNEAKHVAHALQGFFGKDTPNDLRAKSSDLGTFTPPAVMPSHVRDKAFVSPWSRLEQALKVTDLLLQSGGFSAVVLDMASIPATYTSRIPLSHWFRYRAAAEHSRVSVLLLTQQACANSSAGLVLHLAPQEVSAHSGTVLSGLGHELRVQRQRFMPTSNVVPLKKPVAKVTEALWDSRASWAGRK
jgi:RecA/RadA recombinase